MIQKMHFQMGFIKTGFSNLQNHWVAEPDFLDNHHQIHLKQMEFTKTGFSNLQKKTGLPNPIS